MTERFYTTVEIAEMWKLSTDKVQRMFKNEPGVLVLVGKKVKYKRTRQTLRIPESVLERVQRRLTNPAMAA